MIGFDLYFSVIFKSDHLGRLEAVDIAVGSATGTQQEVAAAAVANDPSEPIGEQARATEDDSLGSWEGTALGWERERKPD